MNNESEFEKRIRQKILDATVYGTVSTIVVKYDDVIEILRVAKEKFPKKEATKVMCSDGQEHSYETYDTEAIEKWFLQWFGY